MKVRKSFLRAAALVVIVIAISVASAGPAFAQAEPWKETEKVEFTDQSPLTIWKFSGEKLVDLTKGFSFNRFHRVLNGDSVYITWIPQIVGSGVSTTAGFCRVVKVNPYVLSGPAEWFSLTSVGKMQVHCDGVTEDLTVSYTYHALYDGSTGEIKVTANRYEVR